MPATTPTPPPLGTLIDNDSLELVEVLGRFIPEGKGRWLYRLQEYKDRIRSRGVLPVDVQPDLQPTLDGVCSVDQNVDMVATTADRSAPGTCESSHGA